MNENTMWLILLSILTLGLIIAGIAMIRNKIEDKDKHEECKALGIFMFIIAGFAFVSSLPLIFS